MGKTQCRFHSVLIHGKKTCISTQKPYVKFRLNLDILSHIWVKYGEIQIKLCETLGFLGPKLRNFEIQAARSSCSECNVVLGNPVVGAAFEVPESGRELDKPNRNGDGKHDPTEQNEDLLSCRYLQNFIEFIDFFRYLQNFIDIYKYSQIFIDIYRILQNFYRILQICFRYLQIFIDIYRILQKFT